MHIVLKRVRKQYDKSVEPPQKRKSTSKYVLLVFIFIFHCVGLADAIIDASGKKTDKHEQDTSTSSCFKTVCDEIVHILL